VGLDLDRYVTMELDLSGQPKSVKRSRDAFLLLFDDWWTPEYGKWKDSRGELRMPTVREMLGGVGTKAYLIEPHRDEDNVPLIVRSGQGEDRVPLPSVTMLLEHVVKHNGALMPSALGVFERDDFVCQYCGSPGTKTQLQREHVHPRSLGGENTWGNLVTACAICNTQKANKTLHEMRLDFTHNGRPFRLMRDPFQPLRASSGRYVRRVLANIDRYHPWLEYIPRWQDIARRMGREDLIERFGEIYG